MNFQQLLDGAEVLSQSGNPNVTGLDYDSRRVKSGSAFVAMRGESSDGNKYIDAAIIAGAVAIVSESDEKIADIVDYVVRIPVEDETIFAVLAVLPGQLLPYWCGVGLGLNPDTQRSNVPKHARVWNMLFPPGTH